MSKNELRKEAKRRILGIDREAESAMIVESLRALPEFLSASTILAFCPLSDEPDITPLLSDERVLFPFIHEGRMAFSASRRFHRSPMGFLEPDRFITHTAPFEQAGQALLQWVQPDSGVFKGVIQFPV